MSEAQDSKIPQLLKAHEKELLNSWMQEQLSADTLRPDLMTEGELRQQSKEFLNLVRKAVQNGNLTDIRASEWEPVRELLAGIARSRAQQGYSNSDVATFVLSFKKPLFDQLGQAYGKDAEGFARDTWSATQLMDRLGLFTTDTFIDSRDDIIERQRQEMMELSTPVVKLWEGVLALPLIGTLDSERTQVVMESLLQRIVETGATIAIIDITGVPNVDTLVAQHLLKTVSAAQLMGADCIISGIRPQIAQTIVQLGIDLTGVTTKAGLSDALSAALRRTGYVIARAAS